MLLYWVVAHILLGLVIGSFLNVFILRSRTGKSLAGRSGCFSCGSRLKVLDLIPVVSWTMLGGRCRYCGSAISWQYPLVEIATALIFGVVAYAQLPFVVHLLTLALFSLYIAVVVYDMRHTIIPDSWSFVAAILSLGIALFNRAPHESIIILILSGPLVALPLWLLWILSKGRAIGLGDAKLAISFGYVLGVVLGYVGLVYGFIIGGIIALTVLLPWNFYARLYTRYVHKRRHARRQTFTMKSEVPFGPFLVFGVLLAWVCLTFNLPFPLFPYLV